MKENNITLIPIKGNGVKIEASIWSSCRCIRCGTATFLPETHGFYTDDINDYNIYVLEFCPACRRTSIREFSHIHKPSFANGLKIDLKGRNSIRYPALIQQSDFDQYIRDLSPDFVRVFMQAEHSEQIGLTEISGIGYRKALEFLIKDYTIFLHPDQKETYKTMSLVNAIRTLNNDLLIQLAESCACLGNSQGHYVDLLDDYDCHDLKQLIEATVHQLVAIQKAQEILEQNRKRKAALNAAK